MSHVCHVPSDGCTVYVPYTRHSIQSRHPIRYRHHDASLLRAPAQAAASGRTEGPPSRLSDARLAERARTAPWSERALRTLLPAAWNSREDLTLTLRSSPAQAKGKFVG